MYIYIIHARLTSSTQSLSFPSIILSPSLPQVAWFLAQLTAYILVPGQWVKGVVLRNSTTQLPYKINAFRVLILTHVLLVAGLYWGSKDRTSFEITLAPLVWVAGKKNNYNGVKSNK